MKSKLLLTLWLIGGVLYAGSTLFLANSILGVSGKSSDGMTLASAPADQCETEKMATGADPSTTAAVAPKAPEEAAPSTGQQAEPSEFEASSAPEGEQGPDQAAHTTTTGPEGPAMGPEDEAGALPWSEDGAEGQTGEEGVSQEVGEGEWGRVVAGAADMRAEPTLTSAIVYALPSGWQVQVTAKAPGWVQVRDANSGAAGWVEATAIAPLSPEERSAQYGQQAEDYPPMEERPRRREGQFGDFLRRAFGN